MHKEKFCDVINWPKLKEVISKFLYIYIYIYNPGMKTIRERAIISHVHFSGLKLTWPIDRLVARLAGHKLKVEFN